MFNGGWPEFINSLHLNAASMSVTPVECGSSQSSESPAADDRWGEWWKQQQVENKLKKKHKTNAEREEMQKEDGRRVDWDNTGHW